MAFHLFFPVILPGDSERLEFKSCLWHVFWIHVSNLIFLMTFPRVMALINVGTGLNEIICPNKLLEDLTPREFSVSYKFISLASFQMVPFCFSIKSFYFDCRFIWTLLTSLKNRTLYKVLIIFCQPNFKIKQILFWELQGQRK